MTRDVGDACSVYAPTSGVSLPSARGRLGCLRRWRAHAGDVCSVDARMSGCLRCRRADAGDVCFVDASTSGVSVTSARGRSGMSDMAPSIRAPL